MFQLWYDYRWFISTIGIKSFRHKFCFPPPLLPGLLRDGGWRYRGWCGYEGSLCVFCLLISYRKTTGGTAPPRTAQKKSFRLHFTTGSYGPLYSHIEKGGTNIRQLFFVLFCLQMIEWNLCFNVYNFRFRTQANVRKQHDTTISSSAATAKRKK